MENEFNHNIKQIQHFSNSKINHEVDEEQLESIQLFMDKYRIHDTSLKDRFLTKIIAIGQKHSMLHKNIV